MRLIITFSHKTNHTYEIQVTRKSMYIHVKKGEIPSMDEPKFKTYHGNRNSRPCHNRNQ